MLTLRLHFTLPKLKGAMGCGASSSSRYAGDSPAVSDSVSEVAEAKVNYSSDTPVALANFLVSADIRLVRAEYVWSLCETRKLLPRRQEAEHQSFESPSGKQTSLVTHQEVGGGPRESLKPSCVRFPIAGKHASIRIPADINWT